MAVPEEDPFPFQTTRGLTDAGQIADIIPAFVHLLPDRHPHSGRVVFNWPLSARGDLKKQEDKTEPLETWRLLLHGIIAAILKNIVINQMVPIRKSQF